MICIPRVVDPGRLVEQPFSQMEALDMWLMSRQADVAMKMRFNGWTDESMKQLEVFLEPKVKEFGLFLQKEIAGNLRGAEQSLQENVLCGNEPQPGLLDDQLQQSETLRRKYGGGYGKCV